METEKTPRFHALEYQQYKCEKEFAFSPNDEAYESPSCQFSSKLCTSRGTACTTTEAFNMAPSEINGTKKNLFKDSLSPNQKLSPIIE